MQVSILKRIFQKFLFRRFRPRKAWIPLSFVLPGPQKEKTQENAHIQNENCSQMQAEIAKVCNKWLHAGCCTWRLLAGQTEREETDYSLPSFNWQVALSEWILSVTVSHCRPEVLIVGKEKWFNSLYSANDNFTYGRELQMPPFRQKGLLNCELQGSTAWHSPSAEILDPPFTSFSHTTKCKRSSLKPQKSTVYNIFQLHF